MRRRCSEPRARISAGEDEAVEQALDEAQERQLEQEEADVPAEDRVGDASPSARTGRGSGPEQDRLPRPRDRPADEQGDEQRDAAEGPAGERREVGHVAGLEGDRLAVRRTGRARRRTPERAGSRRSSAAWAASLMRSTSERSDPAALGGWRRGEASGEPEVAEQDDGGEQEGPDAEPERGDRRASRRPSRTRRCWNHRASVHRSIPTLNNRKTAMTAMTIAYEPETPAGPRGSARAAVVGAARRAPRRLAAAASLVVERPGSRVGVGLVGVVVVGVSASAASSSASASASASRSSRSASSSAASGSGSGPRGRVGRWAARLLAARRPLRAFGVHP